MVFNLSAVIVTPCYFLSAQQYDKWGNLSIYFVTDRSEIKGTRMFELRMKE